MGNQHQVHLIFPASIAFFCKVLKHLSIAYRCLRNVYFQILAELIVDDINASVAMAYEITMKSTISTAIIVLESEGRLEERYWNHLRVQNNILDFLYDLWVGSCHSLAADFSTIMKDLVEYDFIIAESIMRERMQSA